MWRHVLIVLFIVLLILLFFYLLFLAWRRRPMCSTGDLQGLHVTSTFAPSRVLGDWYEQARIDTWYEPKGMYKVKAKYGLKPDGTLSVVNSGYIDGQKQVQEGFAWKTPTEGVLGVSFSRSLVPPMWSWTNKLTP